MPSKVGQLQTIPVVVQSLPVVYTVPTDGVATAAITVPLIGSDGRSEGSGEWHSENLQEGHITEALRNISSMLSVFIHVFIDLFISTRLPPSVA